MMLTWNLLKSIKNEGNCIDSSTGEHNVKNQVCKNGWIEFHLHTNHNKALVSYHSQQITSVLHHDS